MGANSSGKLLSSCFLIAITSAVYQNTVLRDVGLVWGRTAITFHERFQCLRGDTNRGELLVVCLKESLNCMDPLLKMVGIVKTSLLSGLEYGMPWEVVWGL